MDSYLANIDTYMEQQEQLERQREHEQSLLQQQQPVLVQQQSQSQHLPQQPLDTIWLSNITELPASINAQSSAASNVLYPDPIFLTDSSTFNMPNNQSYVTDNQSYQQLPPGFDINDEPMRIRKKPGRKPNPASPALRKAQNRAAQRAFRERKERHLKDLDTTIRHLRAQRNTATHELNEIKAHLESYKAESWYLKGIVLTMQFICMNRNIQIPTHSPYLSKETLAKLAQTAPDAIEAYVNAYTRNNNSFKPTMSFDFVDKQPHHSPTNNSSSPKSSQENDTQEYKHDNDGNSEDDEIMNFLYEITEEPSAKQKECRQSNGSNYENQQTTSSDHPISSLEAIQQIRVKLGGQSTLSNNGDIDDRLKPTILQLSIPHDSRIDLVPTPHMRDRMIIFRDQMDYDRCFTMLMNEAVFHGGDPTLSESWELPADFFSEFWYLTFNYDLKKTNKWRREKGLEDIALGPQQLQIMNLLEDCQNSTSSKTVKEMPALQPMNDFTGYPLSPPKQYQCEEDTTEQLYGKLLGGPPEKRQQVASPTLENIIDMLKSSL